MNLSAVALAQLDGDTLLDAAVTDYGDGLVYPFFGNGGSFRIGGETYVGIAPVAIAGGDFDGDSRPDFAVLCERQVGFEVDANVWIDIDSQEFPPFRVSSQESVGADSRSVAVGDFNKDGKQDVVAAVFDSSGATFNGVSVLPGNGDGSFAPYQHFLMDWDPSGASARPHAVAVGDFNSDTWPDVATANSDGDVSLLLNRADGTFGFETARGLLIGGSPVALASADFNEDGRPDLLVANSEDFVTILLGDGSGGFRAPINLAASNGPSAVAVGDFNNDTAPDFVVANEGSGTVAVSLNQHCPFMVCGDGVRSTDEQCDDGNEVGGDGCEANCSYPRSVQVVAPGGTASTDPTGLGTSAGSPVRVEVTTPTGGEVTIQVEHAVSDPTKDFSLFGMQFHIEAPPASTSAPLVLKFRLDASLFPPDFPNARYRYAPQIFRNGQPVGYCYGSAIADPDPCITSAEAVDEYFDVTVLTSAASLWGFGQSCPCDGPPAGGGWGRRRRYVRCVERSIRPLVKSGVLTMEQYADARREARHSTCGMPDMTRCCAPGSPGAACQIRTARGCESLGGTDVGVGVCTAEVCAQP